MSHELHTQIKKFAHLKVPPDAQIIIEVNLTNRHPFKVSTHCIHLTRVDTDPTKLQERSFSVIHTTEAIPVAIVCNLVIVPSCDECEILVSKA
jgi:hypothetical protein